MTLDDLKAQLVEVKDAEVVDDADSVTDVEQDLSDAISLLEDCGGVLTMVMNMWLTKQARQEVEDLCDEIYAYLSQYDVEEKP